MSNTTDSANAATAALPLAHCSGCWTPVGEKMPKNGQKVLVCGHWDNGNRWRTIAEWWPAGTMDASNWDDPPEEWWDDDGNECRCPEDGWWESQVEAETMWALSNVTHWQPLPSFPNEESYALALWDELRRLRNLCREALAMAEAWQDADGAPATDFVCRLRRASGLPNDQVQGRSGEKRESPSVGQTPAKPERQERSL